jgi:hypothetical protein
MTPDVGDVVPAFTVLRGPGESVGSAELFTEGPTALHFYIFDFTGSPEGG